MTGQSVLRELALYLKIIGTVAFLNGFGNGYGVAEIVGFLLIVIGYLVQYVARTMRSGSGGFDAKPGI